VNRQKMKETLNEGKGWTFRDPSELSDLLSGEVLENLVELKRREFGGILPQELLEVALKDLIGEHSATHIDFSRACAKTRQIRGLPTTGEVTPAAELSDEIMAALNFIEIYSGVVPIKQAIPLWLALRPNLDDINILKLA